MTLKCLIVDDEPIAQNIIKGFVEDTPQLEVFGLCDNAFQALELLQQNKVDLLFLDIEMPKLSGLSFLKALSRPPATIITTAYRDFAIEGYELNVIDYLLKPFSFERFLKAVEKVRLRLEPYTKPEEQRFHYFKVDRKNIKVYFEDIHYIEGLSNYVKIHFDEGSLVVYHKLSDLMDLLPKEDFVRIHRSYIISLNKLKAYSNDYVEIENKQLSIGNTYKASFLQKIKK